jgi:sec-independent protein translocase protein TatA
VFLFIFEFLGTSELMVILVVALVLFGPRKLPQLSRQIGKSMAEFKRASEEFKRTWEKEVAMDEADKTARIEQAMLPEENSIMSRAWGFESAGALGQTLARGSDENGSTPVPVETTANVTNAMPAPADENGANSSGLSSAPEAQTHAPTFSEPTRKRDWL